MEPTVIAALLTAIAAIVAPVITAKIEKDKALQSLRVEHFWNRKAAAYKDFSEALGKCRNTPTQEAADNLLAAAANACLFSSVETASRLIDFSGKYLIKNPQSPEDMIAVSSELGDCLWLLNDELRKDAENNNRPKRLPRSRKPHFFRRASNRRHDQRQQRRNQHT